MEKRYLYLVFLALSVLVVLLVVIIFELSGATDTIITHNIEDQINLQNIETFGYVEDLTESWINKIPTKKNQKKYHYPVRVFSVDFK